MDIKRKSVAVAALITLIGQASASLGTAIWNISAPIICGTLVALLMIAGGIGILMMVYAAVKWITSRDDPGARKQAKSMIVHIIVALILIWIVFEIIGMAIGGEPGFGQC